MNKSSLPPALRRLWERSKRLAKKLGDLQARALLLVFYYVVLAPFVLLLKAVADPLIIKARTRRGWHVRAAPPDVSLDWARRQF